MSQSKLTSVEIKFLQETLNADYKDSGVRLREGEYQYELAKGIASFQLELYFPNVKDLIKKLYGEEKTSDVLFIRKIQTILKKLEKNGVIKILPKKKPWSLQRYALLSFKFQDADRNLVVFATDDKIKETQISLQSIIQQEKSSNLLIQICILTITVIASYTVMVWNFMQLVVDPVIFVIACSIAVTCSIMLGKKLSQT